MASKNHRWKRVASRKGPPGYHAPATSAGHGPSRVASQHERLLSALVEGTPEHLLAVDRQHRVVFVNRYDHGFREGDVMGAQVEQLVPEADRAMVCERIESVFETGRPSSYTVAIPTTIGERWYACRLGPVWLGGAVERVSVISTDITEARLAQDAGEREQRFSRALEIVNQAIVAASSAESIVDRVLEAAVEVFDCERAFLVVPCDPDAATWSVDRECAKPGFGGPLGQPQAMSPGAREHMRGALAVDGALRRDPEHWPLAPDEEGVTRFGMKSALTMVIRPPDSEPWLFGIHHCQRARVYGAEVRWFETIGARLTDGLSRVLARRELRQSEARFRTLFEHASEAIVLFDVDAGTLVDANRVAEELFGHTREELRRLSPVDLSPVTQSDGRDSATYVERHVRAALVGELPAFEWEHQRASGELVPCEIRLVRLPDPKRKLIRGSLTDITDRKRAEAEQARLNEQLFQAQKMQALGQLTGGVAHDFNNLLTVIVASLSMMEGQPDNPETTREMIGHASDAAERARTLVHRLLAFARRQPLRPRVVDLNQLVLDMQDLLRQTVGGSVALSLELAPDLGHCEVDAGQLEAALLNLVINSRDAMPQGGTLTVRTHNLTVDRSSVQDEEIGEGHYVALEVLDTGMGMTPEVREQVFEPFFTTKEVGKGSGLGLSVVYGFVRQSHGHVRIESQPRRGTRVTLFLPRTEAPDLAPPVVEEVLEKEPRGNGQRVLVVEDEPSVRRLTAAMVEGLGYECRIAGTGHEALELFATNGPHVDLVLSDVRLAGGMDGAELARKVLERRPEVPVVFMSGYARDVLGDVGRLGEELRFLQKPFSRRALADALRTALLQSGTGRNAPGRKLP